MVLLKGLRPAYQNVANSIAEIGRSPQVVEYYNKFRLSLDIKKHAG